MPVLRQSNGDHGKQSTLRAATNQSLQYCKRSILAVLNGFGW